MHRFNSKFQALATHLEEAFNARGREFDVGSAAAVCIRLGISKLLSGGCSVKFIENRLRECLKSEIRDTFLRGDHPPN